jgi:hypothetical protein
VALNVLNIVQARRKRVLDVDDDDLPVGLALVEKSHDTENLDLLDLASIANLLANLADIKRVIISLGLGLGMLLGGVLPGLIQIMKHENIASYSGIMRECFLFSRTWGNAP